MPMSKDDTLPPGWLVVEHEEIGVTCYAHAATRALCWSKPRVEQTDRPEKLPVPEAEKSLVSACALEEQRAVREMNDRRRMRDNTVEFTKLSAHVRRERELSVLPHERYNTFSYQRGDGTTQQEALRLLRQFCWEVLGARLDVEETIEEGAWPYTAPKRTMLRMLGIVVGEAVSSGNGRAAPLQRPMARVARARMPAPNGGCVVAQASRAQSRWRMRC